ncbi:unnamed protein product, partial [Ectocarpus sp. 12 AP-2014]
IPLTAVAAPVPFGSVVLPLVVVERRMPLPQLLAVAVSALLLLPPLVPRRSMPRDRASHRCMPPRRSIASACSRSSESWRRSRRSRREGRPSVGESRNWRFGRSSERRRSSVRAEEGVKVPPCRPLPGKGRR